VIILVICPFSTGGWLIDEVQFSLTRKLVLIRENVRQQPR
jgi:hypothetical protein